LATALSAALNFSGAPLPPLLLLLLLPPPQALRPNAATVPRTASALHRFLVI
jgi:hypothetical protein